MCATRSRVTIFTMAAGLLAACAAPALATIPYGGAGGPFPGFGPGVLPPIGVGGKEYSHDGDHEVLAGGPPNTALDPQQIVAWDGAPGASGVVNVTDYSGTRPLYTDEIDIDAIANRRDFAFDELKEDRAHLVFSFDDVFTGYFGGGPVVGFLPPGTPPGVVLTNGNVVGGSGELSVELCAGAGCAPNPPDTQLLWAAQADINGMADGMEPIDIDGVEVWGPEPPFADADKYSLDTDVLSLGVIPGDAVSVWNGSGSPYILQSTIIAAVVSLLDDPPTSIDLLEEVNLDALMVQDRIGSPDEFEADPTGAPIADEIIFSIRQIPDPSDPDGYYATGSELFVLDAAGGVSYLSHGGHLWDHTYALSTFNPLGASDPGSNNFAVFDINAIEAIGEFAVPEPTSALLLVAAVASLGLGRRRN
ncbi:MAG: PEP-CTERM sorting domain-containing protein [Planctomycetota bacterium]